MQENEQNDPLKEKKPAQSDNTDRKESPKPKESLGVRFLCAVIDLLIGYFDYWKEWFLSIVAFLVDFFGGLPGFIRYLHGKNKEKRRKKREEKQRIKEEQKEQKLFDKFDRQNEKEQRKNAKRQKKRERKRTFLRWLPALILAAVVLFEAAIVGRYAGGYLLDRIGSMEKAVTMHICLDKNDTRETRIPSQYAFTHVGNEPCFNMTFFASVIGISAYGNERSILYTLPNGQRLRVSNNSNALLIDDKPYDLKNVVRFSGSAVYVPIELMLHYAQGVHISYNQKSKILTLTLDRKDEELIGSGGVNLWMKLLPGGTDPQEEAHVL